MHRDAGIAKVRHLTTSLAGISLAAVVGGAALAHQATEAHRHATTAPPATVSQPTTNPTGHKATAKTSTTKTTSQIATPKPTPTKTRNQAATSGGS